MKRVSFEAHGASEEGFLGLTFAKKLFVFSKFTLDFIWVVCEYLYVPPTLLSYDLGLHSNVFWSCLGGCCPFTPNRTIWLARDVIMRNKFLFTYIEK